MLKDRKFWTGIFMGGIMGASMMLIQPINAAATDNGAALGKIAGAMAAIIKNQQQANKDLDAIRKNTEAMNQNLNDLKKSQGLLTSESGR